jgi:hypothetical protein
MGVSGRTGGGQGERLLDKVHADGTGNGPVGEGVGGYRSSSMATGGGRRGTCLSLDEEPGIYAILRRDKRRR